MIKVNGVEIKPSYFPDGTLSSKVNQSIISSTLTVIDWLYENNEEMTTLYFLVKYLKEHRKILELRMPYIPNARQDRVKHEEDVFYLKYFAEFINDLGFNCVKVRDPHSYVSEALIKNLYVESAEEYIDLARQYCNPDLIFYPDEGAMKRYSAVAPMEYAFGVKRRSWETGKIEGLDVIGDPEKIKGKTILIVDDICSRGGTFFHSAKKLKEMGAGDIYLYITHCENTILDGDVLNSGLIKKVYTTESIFTKKHEKVYVIKNKK